MENPGLQAVYVNSKVSLRAATLGVLEGDPGPKGSRSGDEMEYVCNHRMSSNCYPCDTRLGGPGSASIFSLSYFFLFNFYFFLFK